MALEILNEHLLYCFISSLESFKHVYKRKSDANGMTFSVPQTNNMAQTLQFAAYSLRHWSLRLVNQE